MPKRSTDLVHYAVLAVVFLIALVVPFVFGTLSIIGSMTVFLLLLSWSISWRQGDKVSSDGKTDRSSWLFWGMAGVIAIVIPLVAGTPFLLATMVAVFIYLTWNTMWGLVLGTAGLQSFGVPVLEWWVAVPVAALVGVLVGFLISLPAIRLKGIYFALLTIGLVELCRAYAGQDKCNLGGAQGLYGASSFIPSDMMGSLDGYRYAYAAGLLMVAVSFLIYWKINYGRLGLLLRTARESEPVAEVLGVNVVRARMWVFLISSAMLGVAGGFYVAYYKSVSPNFFSFSTVLLLFAMIMIGGINSPRGILIGTMLLTFVDRRFVDVSPPEARFIFIGLLLLAVTLLVSNGLVSVPEQLRRRLEGRGQRGSGPSADPPEEQGAIEQEAHMPPGSRPGTG